MYVSDTQACNLPNSSSPIPAAAVTAQDAFVARVGSKFVNGDAALSDLCIALGGNSFLSTEGDAGVPSTGAPPPVSPAGTSFPVNPSIFAGPPSSISWNAPPFYAPAAAGQNGTGAGARGYSRSTRRNGRGVRPCAPTQLPMLSVFPVPMVATPGGSAPRGSVASLNLPGLGDSGSTTGNGGAWLVGGLAVVGALFALVARRGRK